MKTKKTSAKRRREIIRELSTLSRNGWAHATPDDYQPLEAELSRAEQYADFESAMEGDHD